MIHRKLALFAAIAALPAFAPARDAGTAKSALVQDRVAAGSREAFQEVRHIVLRGSNRDIGQALTALAIERHQAKAAPASDALRVRAQRKYIERNYPILFERMHGAAAAFGKRIDDDAVDLSGVGYLLDMQAGCSVMHLPPSVTADGRGVVSRDYDFSTGTLDGRRTAPGELPCTARPYIVEMYPDQGYASLSMVSYDLLSGVLDGINSEGLTVALLADDELSAKYKMDPAMNTGVGLGVQQVCRMLLDTCADCQQAKEALLTTKQFYEFIPCHYLVADRHGNAFVWEYSQAHNREYIIENPDRPLVTTNFSLHRHLEDGKPPSAAKVKSICPRYCQVCERLTAHEDKVTMEFIKDTHKSVDALWAGGPFRAPIRTLWHAVYVPDTRSMQVSFYLRDEPGPDGGKPKVVRTEYVEFGLSEAKIRR